jgi:hypothetical protein
MCMDATFYFINFFYIFHEEGIVYLIIVVVTYYLHCDCCAAIKEVKREFYIYMKYIYYERQSYIIRLKSS